MGRGEVWLINLDPTVGSEIKKMRPAVIVNDDAIGVLPLRVIVPLTAWQERYAERYAVAPWMVRLDPDPDNGLDKPSAADALQVRSVSHIRINTLWVRLAPTRLPSTALQTAKYFAP
jgi:mRNA interferase MazF